MKINRIGGKQWYCASYRAEPLQVQQAQQNAQPGAGQAQPQVPQDVQVALPGTPVFIFKKLKPKQLVSNYPCVCFGCDLL